MANHTYCIELMEGDHDYLLSLSSSLFINRLKCSLMKTEKSLCQMIISLLSPYPMMKSQGSPQCRNGGLNLYSHLSMAPG